MTNFLREFVNINNSLPEVLLALTIIKLLIVVAITYIIHKYFTRNKWILVLVAITATYFFFF